MSDDYAVNPTAVPVDDDEEQRRRTALLTMPAARWASIVPPAADPRAAVALSGNAAQGADGLSAPFRALVRNPGNLLMPPRSGMAPMRVQPIAARTAQGYEREPGSGLVLPARGDAAAAAASPAAADTSNNVAPATVTGMAPANVTPIAPGPAEQRYMEDLRGSAPQVPRPGILKRLEIGAAAGARGERAQDALARPQQAADQEYAAQTARDKAAYDLERQQQTDDLNRRNTESEIADRDKRAQPDNPEDKKLESYVNDQGQEALIFQRPDGSTYEKPFSKVQGKQTTVSNPFEAFAYGSPAEKQAAKDFLAFDAQTHAKNDKPGDVEQRYALYQKDPDAYKAMFGDRGGSQADAQGARMLQYFDRQRREIEQDWTLDEPTRAQKLAEIDQLEQPYLDAAGGGKGEDRVAVVSPNGQPGTVPRSQLGTAKKKGYKLAQ